LKLLRGELSNAKDALSGVPNAQLCDSALVAERALDTGKIEIARELAHIIRTQVSDCARAWEVELRAMMTSGDSKGLKGVVAEALAKQGSVPSILQIAGEYFRSQGEFVRAIELVMRAAEKDPREPGLIEGLARALSADPAILPELVAKVEKRQAEGNARVVKDFVLGVSRHLGQDYAGSQSLLKGLKGALPETTILDVYLGSNDYHLGHREEAARRLKAAKVRTEHDVQLYYYRAEVLRDIDRKQAIEDLRRFLPFIQASHQGTTQEATRVKKLLADLEACHKAKEATCKGDWSVPRGAGQEGPPPGAAGTPGPAAEDGPKGGDETPDRSKAPAQEPGPSEGGDGDVGSKGTEAAAEDEENPVLIIVLSLGLLVGALLFRRMKV
jgi:tetratricopeptide (TPR) repeat protein